jgi:TolB-like protein/cytochrome c-type biogenesis protein CcmH/NrfG
MSNSEPERQENTAPLPGGSAPADTDRGAAGAKPLDYHAQTDPPTHAVSSASRASRKDEPAPNAAHPAPTWRRLARNLAFAIVVNGLGSVLVTGGWWVASKYVVSAKPNPKNVAVAASEWAGLSVERHTPAALSFVVLPFINLSGDSRHDHVADGVTDSLTSDLSRALPGSFVVSRATAFTYKGRSVDARQIGRELDVRYALGGSILLEGERVRVNTQLVDALEGSQLWADRFDTDRRSILQVQDEIVARVLRAIGLQVVDREAKRSERERPTSSEAIDFIMRGNAALNRPSSPATMIEARELFEQALKVQPTNVDGLAGIAATLVFEFLNGYYETGGDRRLHRAELLLDRALAIEPRHLLALKAKAALRRAQGKFDDAIATAQAVIAENPGEPWTYKEIGLSTLYLGRPGDAIDWFAKAARIGPRDPGRWTWLDGRGHALILLRRDEEATRSLIEAIDANPRSFGSYAFLAAAYALLGRSDDARIAFASFDRQHPGTRISTFRTRSPVPLTLTSPVYQWQLERLKEGLRKAGMPE